MIQLSKQSVNWLKHKTNSSALDAFRSESMKTAEDFDSRYPWIRSSLPTGRPRDETVKEKTCSERSVSSSPRTLLFSAIMSKAHVKDRESTDSLTKVMDGIHVSVRIRPLSLVELNSGIQSCCSATSTGSLIINKPGDSGAYLKSQASSAFEYAFDAVFDENASQLEVYNRSAKPYVAKVIHGENVTIFAYGATGAGKTHTMFGNTRFDNTAAFAGAGIIPQAVADLFSLLNSRISDANKGETWAVSMSYMEVYNEQVCDLLEPVNKNLPLREDPDRGVVIVAGLSDYKVTSYDEVLELLMRGQVNRKTEATKANIVSSRSHAILQFTVVHTKRAGASSNSIIESKLSLIDLAGSERASATQNSGVRLQESANINKSLLALANCINALSERSSAPSCTPRKGGKKANFNVKYRDSKLTHLLKGSLEGNCNLVMIANVNPADSTHDDTYRTLNYANRAKNMKVKPTTKEVGAETTLAERELRLKEENEELRIRLAKLEENAQHAADSEQQLLQALAQALDALNTAKSQPQPSLPISPVRSTSKLASPTIKKAAVSPVPLPPHNKKKKKRDSSISNLSCSPGPCGKSQGEGKYHTRSSTGSIVYGLDGEDYDCDDNEEDNRDLEYEDEEDEQELENMGGLKSRRTSLDSSPRGGGGGRSSDASVQSRVGSGNSSGLNGRAGAKTAARTSSGSIEGSKPGRLSNELVKKYEVLANVTQAANRADGNLHNTSASATSTSVNDKPARPSFGKISIDPRFEYGHGPAAPSSPPRGFLSRFLCGINKKR